MNKPIMIPIVPNDKFEPENSSLNVPCCWCKHRFGYDDKDPCADCGHNGDDQ